MVLPSKINKKVSLAFIRANGFTLLEVLLGLCVTAVLAVSFVAYTQEIQKHNNIVLAKTEINALLNAATQYHTIYQQWPTTLPTLIPFLGTNAKTSLCSPWLSKTGCAAYTVANTQNYFALKVTAPNTKDAQNLVSMLANAYIDTDNITVIAYTTAFAMPQGATPDGVMFASNQFSGNQCDTSTTPGSRSTGPYGLINVADNTSSSNFACDQNMQSHISYNPQNFHCGPGSQPTMLLIPGGLIPNNSISAELRYFDERYNLASYGPYLELHVNTMSFQSYGNNLPFLDIVCLRPNNITLWPNPYYLPGCGPDNKTC